MNTTQTNFDRGLAHARYQTAGLTAAEADTVRTWRRQAMSQQKRVRREDKRQALAGFVRGLSEWLLAVPA